MKSAARIIAFTLLFIGAAASQDKPKDPVPPKVSEVDQLKIQNLNLRIQMLQKEINDFTAQFTHDHEGWSVNLNTMQLIAPPAKETVKAEPKK
jgi:uncharacterized small protein (DUF1192 family)